MSVNEIVDLMPNETKNLFKQNFNDSDKGFVEETKTSTQDMYSYSQSQCSSTAPSVSIDGGASNSDLGIGRMTSVDSASLLSASSSQISPGPNMLGNNFHQSNSQQANDPTNSDNLMQIRQRMMEIMNPTNNFDSDSHFNEAFMNENADLSNLGLADLASNNDSLFNNLHSTSNRQNDLLSVGNKNNGIDQSDPFSGLWNQQQYSNEDMSMFNVGSNDMQPNNSQVLQNLAAAKRAITGGHGNTGDNHRQNRNNMWSNQQMKPTCSSPNNPWSNNKMMFNGMPSRGGGHVSMNRQTLMIGTDNGNMTNSSPSPSPLGSGQGKNVNNMLNQGAGNGSNMYSMFPKRPQHRMMAYYKQQQSHQQQNGKGSSGMMENDSSMNSIVDSFKMNSGQFSNSEQQMMLEMLKSLECININNRGNDLPNASSNSNRPMVSSGNSSSTTGLCDEQVGVASAPGSYFESQTGNASQSANGFPPGSNNSDFMTSSSNNSSNMTNPPAREEGFSRKVFVGGLPPDIDEEEITTAFCRFGTLVVDWPHKTESKAYFPPKGYCFLLFADERSVQNLISACILDEGKYYWCVSSPTMKDKPVQIRPWSLGDSDFVLDACQPLDPRKTIFVGGVPRPLKAVELAVIMNRLYGGVCYAGIDTDPELKYPKGAGRVAFSNQQSYISAISARFVQLQHNDIDKRVEVKPYVLDNQMCDECQGARCGGKFAPYFCANVTCLQYYCEQCWVSIHSRHGREYHKPLVKEGADRPRPAIYRW